MRRPPNILFIMTDEQRFDCIGANGNQIIKTPNLDKLAAQSANLTSFYVQTPLCSPSRQTYFTGRYPHCHRIRVNNTERVKTVNPDAPDRLMQSFLQEHGYTTACVGKLHYFPPTREYALNTGFDHLELCDGLNVQYDKYSGYKRWLHERAPRLVGDCHSSIESSGKNPFRSTVPEEHTSTTWCGELSRELIRTMASSEKPFFLFSSYHRPHCFFDVPEPFASMYDDVDIPLPAQLTDAELNALPQPLQKVIRRSDDRSISRERLLWMYRSYYGVLSHIDREVGLTLKALEETGMDKNTIVIFCSDHGEQLLEHGLLGKGVFYEGSMRVPMLIRFPGVLPPSRVDDLIESTDFLATIFELAGLPVPSTSQGQSCARLISNDQIGSPYAPHEYIFGECIIPEVITPPHRLWNYPYIRGEGIVGVRHPDAKMVRSRDWKYCYYPDEGSELYNLKSDPAEMINLAGDTKYKDLVNEMRTVLLDWMITCDEPDQIAPGWRSY